MPASHTRTRLAGGIVALLALLFLSTCGDDADTVDASRPEVAELEAEAPTDAGADQVAASRLIRPFQIVDEADLTPEQLAESDAAAAEALAMQEEFLASLAHDSEFDRLLLKEAQTGVPMDWDEAGRALEADGRWRVPPSLSAVDEADLTPEQLAESDAALAEALAVMEDVLLSPGDSEFDRLLVEEARTGVPMDWGEAGRALEADGWRVPLRVRSVPSGAGSDQAAISATPRDGEISCQIVRDPAYYGGWRNYVDIDVSLCRSRQRALCTSVVHERERKIWTDDNGRTRTVLYDAWMGRGCLEDEEEGSPVSLTSRGASRRPPAYRGFACGPTPRNPLLGRLHWAVNLLQ